MPNKPEPAYYTVEDYWGSSFSAGAAIPYPPDSALHRALAVFRDCKYPITRTRFIELGGRPQDLDSLLAAGRVARFHL